jgi:SulP family sulfate permease
LIIQLFFGNVAQLTDTIKDVLKEKHHENDVPVVVIVDFTLVVGMDSSAAHAIAKLKKIIHRLFHVEISIFVTGSDRGGFPCEFALSEALSGNTAGAATHNHDDEDELAAASGIFHGKKDSQTGSICVKSSFMASKMLTSQVHGRVCETLDEALKFAEDILIARQDPQHRFTTSTASCPAGNLILSNDAALSMSVEEETVLARIYWKDLVELPETGADASPAFLSQSIDLLVSMMTREEYKQDNIIWEQGTESTCMKILVSGELLSVVDETGASESVARGNVVGELGLVHGTKRLTTLVCASPRAVLYNLDRSAWNRIRRDHPRVASLIDGLVIRYLAHRVQHVSNRYFHTTLPV